MSTDLSTDTAREAVVEAILRIVPDADPADLDDDVAFRRELELDSLDFLSFVEHLSATTGHRIDEADYPALRTVGSCVDFLVGR